jgi:hypothetical protein
MDNLIFLNLELQLTIEKLLNIIDQNIIQNNSNLMEFIQYTQL